MLLILILKMTKEIKTQLRQLKPSQIKLNLLKIQFQKLEMQIL